MCLENDKLLTAFLTARGWKKNFSGWQLVLRTMISLYTNIVTYLKSLNWSFLCSGPCGGCRRVTKVWHAWWQSCFTCDEEQLGWCCYVWLYTRLWRDFKDGCGGESFRHNAIEIHQERFGRKRYCCAVWRSDIHTRSLSLCRSRWYYSVT